MFRSLSSLAGLRFRCRRGFLSFRTFRVSHHCARFSMTEELEVERLRALAVSQEGKIRRLESALAECQRIGVRLSAALTYVRDENPSSVEAQRASADALGPDGG